MSTGGGNVNPMYAEVTEDEGRTLVPKPYHDCRLAWRRGSQPRCDTKGVAVVLCEGCWGSIASTWNCALAQMCPSQAAAVTPNLDGSAIHGAKTGR